MKIRLLILTAFLALGQLLSAQIRPESRITAVTVFTDRAQVTREATFDLTKGEQKLVFTDLPDQIDGDSIQVKGAGSFMLADVKLTTRFLSEIASEKIRELTESRKGLEARLLVYNDTVAEAESEKRFIENISKKLTSAGESSSEADLNPDNWFQMVAFYREKLTELNAELRDSRAAAVEIRGEIDRINREIQSAGANRNRQVKEVEVVVEAAQAGTARLELSYLVYGPTWIPDYTIRVDGNSEDVSLMYQALVRQSTGEDWTDAQMNLSTARPQVSGRMPELSPWFINAWKPQPFRSSRGEAAAPAMESAPMAMSKSMEMDEAMEEPLPEMAVRTATAASGTTAVIFRLGGKNSIASDNQMHKVTVSVFTLRADFQYASVPKLSPFAYLEAEVTNGPDFPLLPGSSHIFLDGSYVADAYLDQVSPGETFRVSLGIDERFTMKRTLLNRFEETSGLFTKKKKITYEFSIEITNNKKTRETIVLRDQIPVAQTEDISVTLIQPVYRADTPELKKSEQDFLEWVKTVNAGETIKIPFSYSVEYPENMTIQGLE